MLRVNYFEPPDIDECGCSCYAKAFGWCNCEEEDEYGVEFYEDEEELDEDD